MFGLVISLSRGMYDDILVSYASNNGFLCFYCCCSAPYEICLAFLSIHFLIVILETFYTWMIFPLC